MALVIGYICLKKTLPGTIRIVGFAYPHSDCAIFFFNKIELLKNFINYFEKQYGYITKPASKLFCDNYKVINKDHSMSKEKRCALGYSAKEIEKLYNISPRTVEVHIFNMKKKYNLYNRNTFREYFNVNYLSNL